ncbi:MAG: hypothetical protein IT210_21830 [Armatimonadetes bacterium]|nr:hypothetical protein [Armatimonadota bacterium]
MRIHRVLWICIYLAAIVEPLPAGVPAPYTPLKATASGLRCLGRTVRLGRLLFPAQITAAGQPLLSGPIRLAGLAEISGKAKLLENTGDEARWQWRGQSEAVAVESRLTASCDGFLWYEITLTPRKPETLSNLRLEIPRRKETARYLHTARFTWGELSQGLPEMGGKWAGRFMPYIWLGDERRGLAWCAESDEGWQPLKPEEALTVTTEGSQVLFRASFREGRALNRSVTFRFGLHPTPVKPVSFKWRKETRILHNITYSAADPGPDGRALLDTLFEGGVRTVIFHDTWTDYFGKVTTPYRQELRRLLDACHKRGMRLLVYIGYGLARRAPEMQGRHESWSAIPLIPWETSYRPEYRNFDACCPRSGWADWLVSGVDALFRDFDLDGLYFDGTSEAWLCQNESHGCGWKDEAGNLHANYPLLPARRLMRRIADAVHRHRPNAILDVHMSANLTMPTLSFCDSYWDGEQFEHYTGGSLSLPLHSFRTEFMGYAHGLNAEFLCYENRPFTFPEAIALAGLHSVEVRPYPDSLHHIAPLWRAMDAFGAERAAWRPYWEGSGAESGEEQVQASAYLRAGRALLFVSHLERKAHRAAIRLDRRKLHLHSGPLTARDAITGTTLPMEGDNLPVEFEGMGYRVIEVGAGR